MSWNLPHHGLIVNNLYGHTRWTPTRYLKPLHEMPHDWAPVLNKISPSHWKGSEVLMGGWTKWNSAGHADMVTQSSASVLPDWYSRRLDDVRNADTKFCEHFPYDRWSKPTSIVPLGGERTFPDVGHEVPFARGQQKCTGKPANIPKTKNDVFYGIGSHTLYGSPIRTGSLPTLHDPRRARQ
ncbi:hypothetical protein D915_005410 [Fasciola hepatica]|uniref:Uncharacterized protein n=1 Tax=Fasciola hepatica TaxID=6192 RepID=A0A4E0R886_FASHE|nr:hypothetical protein D915_005410 [Fasciola hepatica]